MIFSSRIFDQAAAALENETFYFEINENWGSENPHYRLKIRQALISYLRQNFPREAKDSVLDLNAPPILQNLKVSISHCHGLGGFVLCNRPVGFDMELKSRITSKLLDRIASHQERASAPVPELIWTAKEAIFKCNSHLQTITQIAIQQWEVPQSDTYYFKSMDIEGWAGLGPKHSYALAIKK